MAKQKKRWKSRGTPRTRVTPLRDLVLLPKRGRPKREGDIGPTPQTLAKLEPDLLITLARGKIITAEEAAAGRTIADVWEIVTPAGLRAATSAGGAGDPGTERTKWLERVWRAWANEMFARTMVRHTVVVEWIRGERACDTDPKGAAGVLQKALAWWRDAAQGMGEPPAEIVKRRGTLPSLNRRAGNEGTINQMG